MQAQKVRKILGTLILISMMLFTFSRESRDAPAKRGDVVTCAVAISLLIF